MKNQVGKQSTLYNSQDELEQALIKSQQDPFYYINQGLLLVNLGQNMEAIESYNRAIEINPQFSRAYYLRAISKQKELLFNSALDDLKKAIQLKPEFLEAQILMESNFFQYLEIQEEIKNDESDVQLNVLFSDLNLYEVGDQQTSTSKRRIQTPVRNPSVLLQRGMRFEYSGNKLLIQGDTNQALYVLIDCIRLNDEFYNQFIERGVWMYIFRYSFSSIGTWRIVGRVLIDIQLQKPNRFGLLRLACVSMRKFEDALRILTQVANVNRDFYQIYFDLGMINHSLGNKVEALLNYDYAIYLCPKNEQFYFQRGMKLINISIGFNRIRKNSQSSSRSNESNRTQQQILQSLFLKRQNYIDLANIQVKYGNKQKAISDYTKAIEINSKYYAAYFNRGIYEFKLGLIFQELKKMQEALTDYSKVVDLNPKQSTAYYNKGIVLYDLNQKLEAIIDYSVAIEIDPQFAEALYNRAIAYRDFKQYEDADNDYKKACEIEPQFLNIQLENRKRLDQYSQLM